MFYAISGINGDYEAYKRALAKLKFQNLDDIKEEDIMNEDAVINTLEGEDVLYVVGNIIGAGGGSIKILQDMMSRDNIIAVVGGNEYKITQSLKALDDHIRNTGSVPPQAIMDRITSMLGDELKGVIDEFVELDDDEREDIVDYLDEISEEAFLEVMMARKKFVLVNAGIKGFKADKVLDDYGIEDFVTEPADLNPCGWLRSYTGRQDRQAEQQRRYRLWLWQGRSAWHILLEQRQRDVCITNNIEIPDSEDLN